MKQKKEKPFIKRLGLKGGWRSLVAIVMALVLLELVSALQYYYTHHLLENELEERVLTSLNVKTFTLNATLRSAEQALEDHLWDVERCLPQPDSLYNAMKRLVVVNDKVVGAFLAFTPDYYPTMGRLFEPYVHEHDGTIIMEQIGGKDNHDYTTHPAFQRMLKERKAFWSDPYEYKDASGVHSLTTYSYPLKDSRDSLIAIYGLDVSLEWLGDTLNARHRMPSSFDLFLTESGLLVGGPSEKLVSKRRVERVVALLNDSTAERLATVNEQVRCIEFYDEDQKDKGYIYYMSKTTEPHWQVALVCYDREVYGRLESMRLYVALLMLVGFMLIGFIVHRTILNIIRMQRADMEQERISGELAIAKDIQQTMLPSKFPPYPERTDIDIYGLLVPAREVGGDLFDFFIHDEKLFFSIGDVSGKGVPSALVMAQAHSLFRIVTAKNDDPGIIMQSLNKVLCQNNKKNMFITFFVGVLDLQTGRLCYCNAGHDCPVLVGHGALDARPHLPLGVFDDVVYQSQEIVLPAETTLFLYTDGLTEAMDRTHRQFGLQRLMDALREKESCEELIVHMQKAVQQFVGDAEASDDLTMLALKLRATASASGQAS
jgi:hypothetical protein